MKWLQNKLSLFLAQRFYYLSMATTQLLTLCFPKPIPHLFFLLKTNAIPVRKTFETTCIEGLATMPLFSTEHPVFAFINKGRR